MAIRRLARWIGLGFLGLIIVGAIGAVVLETDWFKEKLRRLAIGQASKYLAGDLSIERLSGSLLRGVTLEGVVLRQDGADLIRANRVTISYDPWTLAHRHFIFQEITIETPSIRLSQGPSGWNLAHLLRPRPPSNTGPIDFAITHFRVTSGDVVIQPAGATAEQARRLTSVNVAGKLATPEGHTRLDFESGSLHDGRSGYSIERLSGFLEGALERAELSFVASRGAARIGGQVATEIEAHQRQVDGGVDLENVDLAALLDDERWVSNITAHVDLRAALPAPDGNAILMFRATGPHARAMGYEATNLSAGGAFMRGQLTFNATASAYGGQATMRADWQVAAMDRTPKSFRGAGRFSNISLHRLPRSLNLPPLVTRLAGQFNVHTDDRGVDADVVLAESVVEDATVSAGTTGRIARHAGQTHYAATGNIAGLDLRRLAGPLNLPTFRQDRFRSQLTGEFEVEGSEGCRSCPAPRMLTGSARLEDATFADTRLNATVASVSLSGSRIEVTANGDVTHLTTETLGVPERLQLDLNGTVTGSLTIPDLNAPLTVESVEAGGIFALAKSAILGVDVSEAQIDGSLESGVLTLREFSANGLGTNVAARGAIALGSQGESALDLAADTDDVAPLGKQIGQPIAGAAHVNATIRGPADAPAIAGSVNARQLAYGTSVGALTLNSEFSGVIPDWDPAQIALTAKTSGNFIKLGSIDLVEMKAQTTMRQRDIDLEATMADAKRQLELSGKVRLEEDRQSLTLQKLSISSGEAPWTLPAGTDATIRLAGSELTVAGLTLEHDAARVRIEGAMPVRAGTTTDRPLVVSAERLQLADINKLLLGTRRIEGVLDATANLRGPIDNPVVEADLSVTGGSIEGTAFESLRANAALQSHSLALTAKLVQSGANALDISGHVPIGGGAAASDAPLDLSVKSTPIDLGLAQMLTAEVTKITGIAELDLRVTGTTAKPQVDGTARMTGGGFMLPATGVSYQALSADLAFVANRLTINALNIADHGGHTLRATGNLDVLGEASARSVDVRIAGNGFQVLDNDMGQVQVNADLRINGDLAGPAINGRLTVDRGRLEVDRILDRTTKNAYSETPQEALTAEVPAEAKADAPPAAKPPASFSDRIAVSLSIELPDNLVMRGRDLRVGGTGMGLGDMNIITGGTLEIRKPAGGSVAVVGDLEVIRGTYSFQGRRFDVQRGSDVRFAGQQVSNPFLNLSAEREVSGVTTLVHVRGQAQRPEITLSSEPPLDQAEILSLIVFGQSLNDLGQGQQTSLAQRAGVMAAGAIATPVADSVARALNLDRFEILAPTDEERAPVVSVGSQIGSRLYVGFKQEIGREDNTAISFEYRFARFLRLVTSFAEGALQAHALTGPETAGIDLIFVFRY